MGKIKLILDKFSSSLIIVPLITIHPKGIKPDFPALAMWLVCSDGSGCLKIGFRALEVPWVEPVHSNFYAISQEKKCYLSL